MLQLPPHSPRTALVQPPDSVYMGTGQSGPWPGQLDVTEAQRPRNAQPLCVSLFVLYACLCLALPICM